MKIVLIVLAISGLLFGCASEPQRFDRYAECTVPVRRDAGLGVKVDGCAVWQFGRIVNQP
jgi:hypothetical protein